jgi:hypothetical protein
MKCTIICLVGCLFLISCNNQVRKIKRAVTTNVKSDTLKHNPTTQKVNDTLTIPEDTVPKIIIPQGTLQVQERKKDSTSAAKILFEGSYNAQDSVGPKDSKLTWKGIFYNKGNYYIKPTQIKFISEHSEFDDDKPDQKTGWRLEYLVKDSCLSIISGVDDLVSGQVKKVKLKEFYYAGQKQEFNYEGNMYTLYSTGTKRNGEIHNFKLFLLANVKGHFFNQQLIAFGNDVALNGGGDSHYGMDLEFVGDIDGDKIPDFIIDVSGFPFGSTYLYLSRTAGNGAILKLVSYYYSSD